MTVPEGATAALEPLPGEARETAVPKLVAAHAKKLYSLARGFCGDAHQAEDVVQETFLQAFRKWDQFEARSSAGTWLYTIAARSCGRMRRKRSGEPERVDSLDVELPFGATRVSVVPSPEDGPATEAVRSEGVERVERAIAGLPDDFRLPLVLHEYAGLPLAQVGQILGIPTATVKTRLHRARLRLKVALDAVLPTAELPPPIFERQVCLDLLHAKQEALDAQVDFAFPDDVVCERCAAVFATLDLTEELCAELGRREVVADLERRVLDRLERSEA